MLTPRQTETLSLFADGLSTEDIAEVMNVKVSTVGGTLHSACERLHCHGSKVGNKRRREAVKVARRLGLL